VSTTLSHRLRIASFNAAGGSVASRGNPSQDLVSTITQLAHEHELVALQEIHWSFDNMDQRFVWPTKRKDEQGPLHVSLGNELYQGLRKTHHVFFEPNFIVHAYHDREAVRNVQWGNMLLVRKNGKRQGPIITSSIAYGTGHLNTEKYDEETGRVYGGQPASRSLQIVRMRLGADYITVATGHGIWSKRGKVDCEARVAQNARWTQLINQHHRRTGTQHPVCFVGDLNLTSKLVCFHDLLKNKAIFGPEGGVNLNAIYKINDTRTPHYKRQEREADFALASPWLAARLSRFTINPHVESDHAVLSLELST
jgi:hypothetical protein